jgi:hypothetical protein
MHVLDRVDETLIAKLDDAPAVPREGDYVVVPGQVANGGEWWVTSVTWFYPADHGRPFVSVYAERAERPVTDVWKRTLAERERSG